jgi:cytochrome c-type biogenesis protein CcmF
VRVYIKPFIDWIWAGCLLMALGGILAVSDRRYRIHKKISVTDVPNLATTTPSLEGQIS